MLNARKVMSAAFAPMLAVGLMPAAALADDGEVATLQAATIEVAAEGADSALAAQAENSNTFTFSDSGVTVSDAGGSGFKVEGTTLTINEAGTYTVTGSCSEGSIKVKKGTTGVTLVLRDLSLTCSETAPLAINKNNGDTSLVIEGTVTLVDAEDPANEDSADAELADAFEGAAVKVKNGSNLIISGTGTLNADGSACKNGIKGGEAVAITIEDGVTVNATAANTGIASDGSLAIEGGTVTVEAQNDGIKVSPDEGDETSAGVLTISGGAISVTAADDGIKADPDAGAAAAASGGTTTITGGTITVSAGDDGIKAYNDLNIGMQGAATGPTINVTESYEGLEAATVNLYSGTGAIVASDDGINAANKDILDGESAELFNLNILGGSWSVNAGGDGLDSNGNLTVSGGTTVVYGPTTGGNGVFDYADRDGSFTVSGGSLLGLSFGEMEVTPTSGTYVVFGGSGMGGMPGGNMPGGNMGGMPGGMGGFGPMTTQGADGETDEASADDVELGAQARGGNAGQVGGGSAYSITAGQTVSVTDSSGTVLASTTAAKNAQWVLYAGEGLQSGSTYALNANGTQLATASATGESAAGGNVGDVGSVSAPANGDAGTGSASAATGSSSDATAAGGAMLRLYNPNSGEHFYTFNVDEKNNLVSLGWSYEGVGWTAPTSGAEVYRLYNPNAGDHHYTTNAEERDYLVSVGWRYEGVGWHSADDTETPLYRLYNPNAVAGAHHYTTSADERDYLVSVGWRSENVGWYGLGA